MTLKKTTENKYFGSEYILKKFYLFGICIVCVFQLKTFICYQFTLGMGYIGSWYRKIPQEERGNFLIFLSFFIQPKFCVFVCYVFLLSFCIIIFI